MVRGVGDRLSVHVCRGAGKADRRDPRGRFARGAACRTATWDQRVQRHGEYRRVCRVRGIGRYSGDGAGAALRLRRLSSRMTEIQRIKTGTAMAAGGTVGSGKTTRK